jgi:hypothetical protein
MNIEQVKKDIEQWIVNFVEVPHPALGGWPPCPYARAARLRQSYDVRLGTDPLWDLKHISEQGLQQLEVVILAYDPEQWPHTQFSASVHLANQEILLAQDLIALEDHPEDPEIVHGISMNQGTHALILIQCLSDLNQRSAQIASKGFYHAWPKPYLQSLFQHRQDPQL